MEISLDALPNDPAALRDIILAQQQKIAGMEASSRAYEALIQALKLTIARLKRQRYGSSSEKIDREIAQLELALEGLEMAGAATDPTPEGDEPADAAATDTAATAQLLPPRRRGKPRISADAPRESITLDPGAHCPDCGGVLRLVGEDVAEILDFIAAKLKVIEVHRPKKSCRDCERMVQTPAPSKARRPWRRGRSRAVWLGRRYWRISWSRSSTITFRSTGRARSSPVSAPTSPARHSSTGAARLPVPSARSPT